MNVHVSILCEHQCLLQSLPCVISPCTLRRFGYINWLWYGWGATMINQYKDSDIKIYGDTGVLEYYSLNGISEWAFLGYSALTFVFFFFVAYIVSSWPLPFATPVAVLLTSVPVSKPAAAHTCSFIEHFCFMLDMCSFLKALQSLCRM